MDDPYQRIADLLRAGRKIEAIKLLRETTGVSLKEAKDEVDRLSLDLAGDVEPPPGEGRDLPDEVRTLAAQGKKIEAIKALREQSGLSLKEAKARVDEMTGGSSGGGCLGSVLLLWATGVLLVLLLG